MGISFIFQGTEVYLKVKGYGPAVYNDVYESYESPWCECDYTFKFPDGYVYSEENSEILGAHEIEYLEKELTDLLEENIDEAFILGFIEPDFVFDVYDVRTPNMYWNIYDWGKDETLCIPMDRERIIQLRDYLRTVIL